MTDIGKHNVLGIRVSAIDYDGAVERILHAAQARQALGVSALAVHGLMEGVLDSTHRFRLNQLDLLVPDGQPVRWALNWLHGTGLRDRVYGPTLMLKVCERAAAESLSVFLFGGTPELLQSLATNLQLRFPGLRIAGTLPSRFRRLTAEERDETIQAIRNSGAAITLVGLGCPRQEVWAYEFREALSMPLLAVGAAFNFLAGALPQAPPVLQRNGLEWLFRLVHEPRRLWKRYLLLNPLYLGLLTLQITGMRQFSPDNAQRPTEEFYFG